VPPSYRRAVHEQAKRQLDEWLTTTATPGTPGHIVEGAPAHEIVRFANDRAMDLIVVGTHGQGGMSHFLTGSVAEKVVRTATCPVLTVRPKS
jgi:nucleotide-binding universal stress UspA family protein